MNQCTWKTTRSWRWKWWWKARFSSCFSLVLFQRKEPVELFLVVRDVTGDWCAVCWWGSAALASHNIFTAVSPVCVDIITDNGGLETCPDPAVDTEFRPNTPIPLPHLGSQHTDTSPASRLPTHRYLSRISGPNTPIPLPQLRSRHTDTSPASQVPTHRYLSRTSAPNTPIPLPHLGFRHTDISPASRLPNPIRPHRLSYYLGFACSKRYIWSVSFVDQRPVISIFAAGHPLDISPDRPSRLPSQLRPPYRPDSCGALVITDLNQYYSNVLTSHHRGLLFLCGANICYHSTFYLGPETETKTSKKK